MSRRQQLVAMYSMLDHVAQEAGRSGYGLVTTLAAAAAEAARDELVALDRPNRLSSHPSAEAKHLTREKIDSLA
jgi:uncharacterized protein YbbC (DUF1343 family)